MLKEVLRTTYFRGRGDQRIRKVIRLTIEDTDWYEVGVGFREVAGLPALTTLIPATIRDATLRTIEPRIRPLADFAFQGFLQDTHCILDVATFNASTKEVGIRAYGKQPLNGFGGLGEPLVDVTNLLTDSTIDFEIEYTSNSGAEG